MNSCKSTYRIAVCFSGQARHWKESAENIKNFFDLNKITHPNLGIPIEVDYFIHTWDTNTWNNPKSPPIGGQNEKFTEYKELRDEYNPKEMIVSKWNQNDFYNAFNPMFYSHSRSLMLKRDYEITNDFRYDLVIKARLDTVYDPRIKFPLHTLISATGYTITTISKFAGEFNNNTFDDVLFYGDSQTMDIIGDLYNTYMTKIPDNKTYIEKNNALNIDINQYVGPGSLLHNHMSELNIYPTCNQTVPYAVYRSTMKEKNLNPMSDFEEIRKLWFDWYA